MAVIAISGSTGFIGSALVRALQARGAQVRPLVRPQSRTSGIHWDPARGEIDSAALEGVDAVVHLAGESVAEGRWTAAQKARITESRVVGTGLLARALAGLSRKPGVLLSASAIGFYGDCGERPVTEEEPPGTDFLASVCVAWEKAAQPARDAGIRVVHPRFGIVLHPSGGALAKMLPVFRLGLGGPLGDGRQRMSWISLDDAVGALLHALDHPTLTGPLNLTSPDAVSNAELSRALGKALHRPAFMRVPGFALRAALGEMADVALLGGARVAPQQLLDTGFVFAHPSLEPYLRGVLSDD